MRKEHIMRSCLVVCYSRTGLTAKLGREIANSCDADFELIREERDRSGPLGLLRSAWEAVRRRRPAILAPEKDACQYALVILGSPVWAGHMSSPMRTYILGQRNGFHRVALFCTMGGRDGDAALAEMAQLCGKEAIAKVAVSDKEIGQGNYYGQLAPLLRCAQLPAAQTDAASASAT
jgi:flavodoxin